MLISGERLQRALSMDAFVLFASIPIFVLMPFANSFNLGMT